jgi:hypothetical protein
MAGQRGRIIVSGGSWVPSARGGEEQLDHRQLVYRMTDRLLDGLP